MTTINDISDLARILQEQPEWAATLRNLLLTEELLSLPAQLAEFVQETRENNRLASERLAQLEEFTRLWRKNKGGWRKNKGGCGRAKDPKGRVAKAVARSAKAGARAAKAGARAAKNRQRPYRVNHPAHSIEGRFANYEGGYYERSVRNRVVLRARDQFGFQEPYLAMVNDAQSAPELSRAESLALNNQAITAEEVADLHDADIIVSGTQRPAHGL